MKHITALLLAVGVASIGSTNAVAAPVPPEPTVIASADCTTFHIEVANYDGRNVMVGVGAEPPYNFHQAIIDIPADQYSSTHSWTAAVTIGFTRAFSQFVDCTTAPVVAVADRPVPVVVFDDSGHSPTQPTTDQSEGRLAAIWAHVELAPPW